MNKPTGEDYDPVEEQHRDPAWGPRRVTGRVQGWQVAEGDERSEVFWRRDAAEAELETWNDPEAVVIALVQPDPEQDDDMLHAAKRAAVAEFWDHLQSQRRKTADGWYWHEDDLADLLRHWHLGSA